MAVIKKLGVFLLSLSLSLYGISAYAGMHGNTMKGSQSEMAGSHGEKGHMMSGDHGKVKSGHGSTGETVFSGSAFDREVTGSIIDVMAAMSKSGKGMSTPAGITHHFMITPDKPFEKETNSTVVVTYPGGEKKEVKLSAMGNHIGGDLNLDEKGTYQFTCIVSQGAEDTSITFPYEVK